jgi:hypothetical protein
MKTSCAGTFEDMHGIRTGRAGFLAGFSAAWKTPHGTGMSTETSRSKRGIDGKYKAMEAESASALLLSTLSLVVTVPIIIAIS